MKNVPVTITTMLTGNDATTVLIGQGVTQEGSGSDREAETVTGITPPGADLIPDHVQVYINFALSITLLPFLGLFGAASNLINIAVFVRQGCSDCVSVCLVSLAISDLAGCIMAMVYGLANAVVMSETYFYLDPNLLLYFSLWALAFCGDITMAITAFISVERALCVLLPFRFKDLITFRRALSIVAALYIVVIASFMPVFATMGPYMGVDATVNRTRILLWLSSNRKDLETYLNIYQNTVASVVAQAVVVVSTAGMVLGLRRSSKFQTAKTATKSHDEDTNEAQTKTITSKQNSNKHKTVIKMVSCLATIFIVCNFFRLIVIVVRRVEPRIDFKLQFHNVFQTCAPIYLFWAVLNSSVNMFIYCRYKPNFGKVLASMICFSAK